MTRKSDTSRTPTDHSPHRFFFFNTSVSFPFHAEDGESRCARIVRLRTPLFKVCAQGARRTEDRQSPPSPCAFWCVGNFHKGHKSEEMLSTTRREQSIRVKRSHHYGRSIGRGAFVGVFVPRGQFIAQFRGRITTFVKDASDYHIHGSFGGRCFVVSSEREDGTPYPVAFTNEPSPLPFKVGDTVMHRNRRWKFAGLRDDGLCLVDDGKGFLSTCLPEDIDHPLPRKYRANCVWFDFPFPIELFDFCGVDRDRFLVYRQTGRQNCVVSIDRADKERIVRRTRRKNRIRLVGGVFEGMQDHGELISEDSDRITVRLHVRPGEMEKLPPRVVATKYLDRIVPLPVVFATDDIHKNEELLCLYDGSTRAHDKSRGLPSAKTLMCGAYQSDMFRAYVDPSEPVE